MPIDIIGRVTDRGRVESRDPSSRRATALPADALHQPWWVFGSGHSAYLLDREQARRWVGSDPSESEREAALETPSRAATPAPLAPQR